MSKWKPQVYVRSWLAQHRSTTDSRTRVAAAAVEEDMYAKSRPSVGYFVNCWSVALVNAKRLRRSLTVLQTRNTFGDVPSNADLSIACAAEQRLEQFINRIICFKGL